MKVSPHGLIVVVVPLATGAAAERWISVPQGGEILLTQRETVNDAWGLPKEVTMDGFVESHPEWTEFSTLADGFDWKWYYAFQQLRDESVAELSTALREGIRQRDDVMGNLRGLRLHCWSIEYLPEWDGRLSRHSNTTFTVVNDEFP